MARVLHHELPRLAAPPRSTLTRAAELAAEGLRIATGVAVVGSLAATAVAIALPTAVR